MVSRTCLDGATVFYRPKESNCGDIVPIFAILIKRVRRAANLELPAFKSRSYCLSFAISQPLSTNDLLFHGFTYGLSVSTKTTHHLAKSLQVGVKVKHYTNIRFLPLHQQPASQLRYALDSTAMSIFTAKQIGIRTEVTCRPQLSHTFMANVRGLDGLTCHDFQADTRPPMIRYGDG